MQRLTKGANAGLLAASVVVEVGWDAGIGPADLDVLALVLGLDGRVGGDADLVFWGAPQHPSGAVRLGDVQTSGRRSIEVDLSRLDGRVEGIALVVSADGAVIGDSSRVEWSIADASSRTPLAASALSGARTETAVLLMELYRRDGGWKVRAVAQGWDAGLTALVEEYGVVLDGPGAGSPAESDPVSSGSRAPDSLGVRLTWEVARAGRIVGLDADAVLLDTSGGVLSIVGSRTQVAVPGVVGPRGSERVWTFTVRPAELAPEVSTVAFTLTSAGGQRFTEVSRAAFEVTGTDSVVEGAFEERERRTGLVLVEVTRLRDGWTARGVGRFADARTGGALFDSR